MLVDSVNIQCPLMERILDAILNVVLNVILSVIVKAIAESHPFLTIVEATYNHCKARCLLLRGGAVKYIQYHYIGFGA